MKCMQDYQLINIGDDIDEFPIEITFALELFGEFLLLRCCFDLEMLDGMRGCDDLESFS